MPKINQVRFATKGFRGLGLKFGIPCHTTLKHPKTLIFSKRLLKTGMEYSANVLVCQKST